MGRERRQEEKDRRDQGHEQGQERGWTPHGSAPRVYCCSGMAESSDDALSVFVVVRMSWALSHAGEPTGRSPMAWLAWSRASFGWSFAAADSASAKAAMPICPSRP